MLQPVVIVAFAKPNDSSSLITIARRSATFETSAFLHRTLILLIRDRIADSRSFHPFSVGSKMRSADDAYT